LPRETGNRVSEGSPAHWAGGHPSKEITTNDDVKRILVVSRSTKYSSKGVHYGISLARALGAELFVLHVFDDVFRLEQWQLPIPSLRAFEEEYRAMQERVKGEIDEMIWNEHAKGLPIQVLMRDGNPERETLQVVEENKIDLLIIIAYSEGRLEHFLFGRTNEDLLRKLPCSVLFVKKHLGKIPYRD
jgi:nucleotide-binding universal stress UspA family protein